MRCVGELGAPSLVFRHRKQGMSPRRKESIFVLRGASGRGPVFEMETLSIEALERFEGEGLAL